MKIALLYLSVFGELLLRRCFLRAKAALRSPTRQSFSFILKVENRSGFLCSRIPGRRCPGCLRRALSVNLVLSSLEGNQVFNDLDAMSQFVSISSPLYVFQGLFGACQLRIKIHRAPLDEAFVQIVRLSPAETGILDIFEL